MLPLRAIVPVRLHRPAEMRCCRLAARARALHRKHVSTLDMTERALMVRGASFETATPPINDGSTRLVAACTGTSSARRTSAGSRDTERPALVGRCDAENVSFGRLVIQNHVGKASRALHPCKFVQ